jgi:hypothetical protein
MSSKFSLEQKEGTTVSDVDNDHLLEMKSFTTFPGLFILSISLYKDMKWKLSTHLCLGLSK